MSHTADVIIIGGGVQARVWLSFGAARRESDRA